MCILMSYSVNILYEVVFISAMYLCVFSCILMYSLEYMYSREYIFGILYSWCIPSYSHFFSVF